MAYAWGCHGVEVEVDRRTGQIDIVRYIAAHDVGKAINPLLLRGQILGGGLQGIGWALAEEMIFEEGRLLNPNFRDYKMLTALDSVDVEPILVEDPAAAGPYGAKGIGEPGLVPTGPRHRERHLRRGGDPAEEAAHEAGDGAGEGGAVGLLSD